MTAASGCADPRRGTAEDPRLRPGRVRPTAALRPSARSSLELFKTPRDSTAELLERMQPADWLREGTHNEVGTYTPETWLRSTRRTPTSTRGRSAPRATPRGSRRFEKPPASASRPAQRARCTDVTEAAFNAGETPASSRITVSVRAGAFVIRPITLSH